MFSNSVNEFDDLLADSFATFLRLSENVGPLVKEQTALVKKALAAQRDYIELASRSQKPADSQVANLLKPTSDLINQIQSTRDANRKSEFFNQLSAISEGIPALGWVTISPTPGPYVKEMLDAAQFYTNKVLVSFKDKDPGQVEWAKSWIQFLSDLQIYVRKNHTTGLVWNAKGSVVSPQNFAPPPPPPPAAGFFDDVSSSTDKSSSAPDTRAALFASINQGTDITRALKKVNSEQMTHKNPSLRQSNVVPEKKSSGGGVNGSVRKEPAKLPAKLELEGKKWLVENQHGNNQMTISDTNMSQSVNVYNCSDSLLIVKGKVNSITVNKCKKFSIVFDNIVAVVEFIDCQRVKAQVNGVVPTITADKVDGIEVFFSKESLDCEIVSSKSSEINLSVQNASEDYVEHPIPEQFKSIWNGKGFTTVAVDKN